MADVKELVKELLDLDENRELDIFQSIRITEIITELLQHFEDKPVSPDVPLPEGEDDSFEDAPDPKEIDNNKDGEKSVADFTDKVPLV